MEFNKQFAEAFRYLRSVTCKDPSITEIIQYLFTKSEFENK